jgi:hypothetical protein
MSAPWLTLAGYPMEWGRYGRRWGGIGRPGARSGGCRRGKAAADTRGEEREAGQAGEAVQLGLGP